MNDKVSPDKKNHFMPLAKGSPRLARIDGFHFRGMPSIVDDVLRSPSKSLDAETRAFMGPHFGHDLSHVRVHTDGNASNSARSISARAYTLGPDIVFGSGQYNPRTSRGQQLIAHELTHVVQQQKSNTQVSTESLSIGSSYSAAEKEARESSIRVLAGESVTPSVSTPAGAIQRDGTESGNEEEQRHLQWPGLQQRAFPHVRLNPDSQLHLDPDLQAQFNAMRMVRALLEPDYIRAALLQIDFDAFLTTQPPPWLRGPETPTPGPLVPRGAGPATPRQATGGDVFRAIFGIPAVSSGLNRLRSEAEDRAARDWRRLSTGQQVLVISHTVALTGGMLTGVLSNAEARNFVLGLVQNQPIPVPGVSGLTFQFNLTGPNQSIRFDLNVGALLPRSLGFR
jgi:hypothetical protein